jgi:hypothetical protein
VRILVAISHFFHARGGGFHGSRKAEPERRLACLRACIMSLHQTFGPRQWLVHAPTRSFRRANESETHEIDVVICTTGGAHLVSSLKLPAGSFRHHETSAEPMLLGYECHAVLRDALGRYDCYAYLEDDLAITDPLFFIKLRWFTGWAGNDCVLQPNRFELSATEPIRKLYCDGNLVDPTISPRYQDIRDHPKLAAELMGRTFTFQRVDNPHAGCFFLNAEQMARWAARPDFLDRATGFWGPLESAATLGVMRAFRAYKPARECAGFLEIRHLDNRYLGGRLKITPQPPHSY